MLRLWYRISNLFPIRLDHFDSFLRTQIKLFTLFSQTLQIKVVVFFRIVVARKHRQGDLEVEEQNVTDYIQVLKLGKNPMVLWTPTFEILRVLNLILLLAELKVTIV